MSVILAYIIDGIASFEKIVNIFLTLEKRFRPNRNKIPKKNEISIPINVETKSMQAIPYKKDFDFKSDKDIRDYIDNEMANMPLVHVNFNDLSKKFIGIDVDFIVNVNNIEEQSSGKYKVFFTSSTYSRMEYALVDLNVFNIVNFIKKNDLVRLKAKIIELDSSTLGLDDVIIFEKVES